MNSSFRFSRWVAGAGAGLAVLLTALLPAHAFPPAPDHVVFGMVRDEQGNPLNATKATVLLEVGGTVIAQTTITTGLELGVNYRMTIPLDAGITGDKYKPTALLPTVPFRLRVKIGTVNYLPIEMTGLSSLLTKPGGLSRVDLTLGEDSDGDGLPDAWERALIAAMGGGKTLADIRPGDDADGDGLTNLQEYLAGTYAFDPADGFALSLVGTAAGSSLLEFTAIRGRTYTIEASTDMQAWTQVAFTVPGETPAGTLHDNYAATDVRLLRALVGPETVAAGAESRPRFFKLMVH